MSERKVYGGTRRHSFFDRSSNPGETYNIDEILAPISDEEAALLNDVDAGPVLDVNEFYSVLKREGLDGLIKTSQDNLSSSCENQVKLKFSLEDVKKLINKMEKKNIIKPREYLINIPFIGRNLYERAWLEKKKIEVLKEQLEKAENGTELDRQRFIDELEPLLASNVKFKR